MSDVTIPALVLEFQARSLYVQQLLQAEVGIKEYDADWLGNTGQVMRDATGKFAKKGTTVDAPQQPQAGVMPGTMQMPGLGQAQQMTWTAMDMLENGAEITSDLIQGLVQDPGFRQRAGLVAGLAGAKALERILEKSKIDPRLEAKLNDFIAEATQKLADEYGDDKDPFAQAIRTSGKDELPPGVPLEQRMEYDLAKYQSYVEALKNPKKYDKKKELMGKAVKASIPLVAYLGLTLGPEVLIGLVMKESLEAILVSAAVGQAVSFGANKAMDKANIENQWVRAGIDLAVGIAAGGLLASNKHFKVLSKADQATRQGKKIAETAIKNTEEGTFYDKLSKPVKEFMDARAKDILDSVKPLQEIKPTGIKLPDMKDVGWLSKGQFFQDSVLAIPKELRSLPSDFIENLFSIAGNVKYAAIRLDSAFGGYALRKYLKEETNQLISATIDGVERKILVAKNKVSRGIDAAGEAVEDAFWWLLPKGMDALDASANWVDDVARKMDDIYESKIKTFRPKVEKDIDDLKKNISQEIDNIKTEISKNIDEASQSLKDRWDSGKKEAQEWADNTVETLEKKAQENLKFAQEDGLNRLDDILESLDNLYNNEIKQFAPQLKSELDNIKNQLSQEIGKLKIPELTAKLDNYKAIANQWVDDAYKAVDEAVKTQIDELKTHLQSKIDEISDLVSTEIDKLKTSKVASKLKNPQELTQGYIDDASKAMKDLYEKEIKTFKSDLEDSVKEMRSLISRKVGDLKKSPVSQNIKKWVDDTSNSIKELYENKIKTFGENLKSKANKIKDDIALEINSLKSMGSAFDWDGGLSESFNPQKVIDNISNSVQDLYKNKIQTIKPRVQKEMDELADHLSQEVGKLKNSELAAKFKGKKAITDQWAKDISESIETFYNSEIKNFKPNIEKEIKELQRIASQGIEGAKNKVQDYQKLTKQWSDDASKALKELYENEIKNFQPNLQQEMAGLKSLMSKQIKRFGEQTSLTAQNVETWVNNVSATLKKLYQDKSKELKIIISKKVNELKSKLKQVKTKDIHETIDQPTVKEKIKEIKLPDDIIKDESLVNNLNRLFGEKDHDARGFVIKDQKFTAASVEFEEYNGKKVFSFAFGVNDADDMLDDTILTPQDRIKSALKIKKIFNYFLANMEEGSIVQATPYADDGFGDARTMLYQAFGFVKGSKNNMYAKVSNGKLHPIEPSELVEIDNKINFYYDYIS